MAFSPGYKGKLIVGGYDLSPFLSSVNLDKTRVELETTNLAADGDREFIGGLRVGRLSAQGYFDGAANAVDERLNAAFTGASQVVSYFPGGYATLGDPAQLLKALDSTYAIPVALEGLVGANADMTSDGGVDRGRILHVLTAETATANGTGVDHGAATANGGVGVLHVTAISGTPTFTAKVQHSTDGSVWADLITFASASASVTAERVVVTGTVNRHLRAIWTVTGGSSPSITFVVSFARR